MISWGGNNEKENLEKCLLEKSFTFNLEKTERKKVILFKGYLDFSQTHDFREMAIFILHVTKSSKTLTSADFFCIFELPLSGAKYPENFVPKALLVLELEGGTKVTPLL